MAKRIAKKEINFNASELKVVDIVEKYKGGQASIAECVASLVVVKEAITEVTARLGVLEELQKLFTGAVKNTPYENIVTDLIDQGDLCLGEKPVYVVKTKSNQEYNVDLGADKDEGFQIDPALRTKSTLEMLDAKYVKTTTSLNAKVVEADYDAGILPDIIKNFCQKHPMNTTKIKITLKKEEE